MAEVEAHDTGLATRTYYDGLSHRWDTATGGRWAINGMIKPYMPRAVRSLLDLGAGTGQTIETILETLSEQSAAPPDRVVAVDYSEQMLDRLRARKLGLPPTGLVVVQDSIEHYLSQVPESDGDRHSLITGVGSFETVPELPEAIADLRQHVVPGGRVIFTYETYMPDSPNQRLSQQTFAEGDNEFTVHRWGPYEMCDLLNDQGWDIIANEPVQGVKRGNEVIGYTLVAAEWPAPA
jgi:SAM-dependent methyltransferase